MDAYRTIFFEVIKSLDNTPDVIELCKASNLTPQQFMEWVVLDKVRLAKWSEVTDALYHIGLEGNKDDITN